MTRPSRDPGLSPALRPVSASGGGPPGLSGDPPLVRQPAGKVRHVRYRTSELIGATRSSETGRCGRTPLRHLASYNDSVHLSSTPNPNVLSGSALRPLQRLLEHQRGLDRTTGRQVFRQLSCRSQGQQSMRPGGSFSPGFTTTQSSIFTGSRIGSMIREGGFTP